MRDVSVADGPIEAHLGDGGHVIVTFEDPACRVAAGDLVAEVLVLTDGSEADIQRAITAVAEGHGIACTISPTQHPTVIVVGRA